MKSNNRRLVPALSVALVFLIYTYNRARDGQREERSFIEVTGLDFGTFRELVDLIATDDEKFGTIKTGRPKLLSIQDEVGVYLLYVNSMMQSKHLALLFGVLPTNITATVKRMMKRVV